MSILDYLSTNQVMVGIPGHSKKQVIEEFAERVASLTSLSQRCLLDMVMRRERLGSTGIGGGIAIPHAVHNELKCTIAFLAILTKPVDFDSIDGKPVDIICLIIGPPNENGNHLKCIASVIRSLAEVNTCDKLRAVTSPEAVLQSLKPHRSVAA